MMVFPKSRSLKRPFRARGGHCTRGSAAVRGAVFAAAWNSRPGAGTKTNAAVLSGIMPGCRKSLTSPVAAPQARAVSVTHYVFHGRRTMRASNDNPRSSNAPHWYWALAIGALPTACAAAILAILL